MQQVVKKLHYKEVSEFYRQIADGTLDMNTFIETYLNVKQGDRAITGDNQARSADEFELEEYIPQPQVNDDVLIIDRNLKGVEYQLARCCNPIYGDSVFGFVTVSGGIKIHRTDCPNVLQDTDFSRLIDVGWDIGLDKQYTVELEIVCNDRSGILNSVLAVPTEMKINIHSINANPNRSNKTSTIMLGLDVRNSTQVTQIVTKLRRVKDVYSVVRKMSSNANG
jgi:(p)ppGpp synthase/HD superfamily hydrolase